MKSRFLAAATIGALWASGANANPDVWVTVGATYRFEDAKITAITFEWRFDQYFSGRTIETYDANANGKLEPEEVAQLRRQAFDPLQMSDYHVHIWEGEKKREGLRIEKFDARIDGTILVYRFAVVVDPPADPTAEEVVASLFDKEIVLDFRFQKKNFLFVEGTMSPDCKFKIGRRKGAQSGHPQPVTLKCGVPS